MDCYVEVRTESGREKRKVVDRAMMGGIEVLVPELRPGEIFSWGPLGSYVFKKRQKRDEVSKL